MTKGGSDETTDVQDFTVNEARYDQYLKLDRTVSYFDLHRNLAHKMWLARSESV